MKQTALKIFPLAIVLMLSCVSSAAPLCQDYFSDEPFEITQEIKKQNSALGKIAIEHFYEKAIKALRKNVTSSSVQSTEAVRTKNRLSLTYSLKSGNYKEATHLYQSVFDDVELSFFRIKQDLATLEKMRANSKIDKSDMAQIQARLQVYQRRFAKSYGEYIETRRYLEDVIRENKMGAVYVEAARKTLANLGVHEFSYVHADFEALKIPEQRPSLQEIEDLFGSRGLYVRIKLFNDFKSEIVAVLKYFISSEILVGTLDSIFSKFPCETATKLKKFTGLMNSMKVRFRYLGVILDIEKLPPDATLRFEALRKKNAATAHDDLLVTYARTVDFTDSWNSLKATAKERAAEPDNAIYKNFYDRMLIAEAKALKLQDISIFDKDSNIDNLLVVIQTGLLLKFAGPSVFHSTGEFFNYVLTVFTSQ